jgi:dihydroorotate dehydrogenase
MDTVEAGLRRAASMQPELSYDIHRTWEENAAAGPRLNPESTEIPETPMKSFLGLPVRSRIGIAAGLLLNHRWVLPYARRGFDLLTYKTVRSAARPCYPLPNWVFVRESGQPDGTVVAMDSPGCALEEISSSVCFGMPSVAPEEWRADIRRTRDGLGDGQVLIVSVVGTPAPGASVEELAEDYARCAAWAVESGAQVVEANLSCPNVCSSEGTLYQDPVVTRVVVERLRRAAPRTPLLLKIGAFDPLRAQMEFLRTVNGLADGVTLLNGMSRPVVWPDGRPVFGETYRTAGVLGRAIHPASVEAVRSARRCVESDRLNLSIAAVGGASTVRDIGDFFDAGADAVLCGSSPMYLPGLAAEAKRCHPEW